MALVVKNLLASAGDIRDTCSIPGLGRSPGGGHGNPLQYSCLEHPLNRGPWRATVHRVAKSQTGLKRLSAHMHAWMQLRGALGCQQVRGWSESLWNWRLNEEESKDRSGWIVRNCRSRGWISRGTGKWKSLEVQGRCLNSAWWQHLWRGCGHGVRCCWPRGECCVWEQLGLEGSPAMTPEKLVPSGSQEKGRGVSGWQREERQRGLCPDGGSLPRISGGRGGLWEAWAGCRQRLSVWLSEVCEMWEGLQPSTRWHSKVEGGVYSRGRAGSQALSRSGNCRTLWLTEQESRGTRWEGLRRR